jgi:polygalacturonase
VKRRLEIFAILMLLALFGLALSAQTLATGDGRGVQTEPTFPTGCTKVAATKTIATSTSLNVDPLNATISTPNALGGTGGTSLEPNSETLDNTTASGGAGVQTKINAASPGSCVELTLGSPSTAGFVLAPITMRSGVNVVVDAGVTVFLSRNPADYGGGSCGTFSTTASTSCGTHWMTDGSGTTGSGIYGYGVIDGRCWDRSTSGSATSGFCYNRTISYCLHPLNGHTWAGITCTGTQTTDGSIVAYGPDMFHLKAANTFTAYKITMKDCDNFCFYWGNSSTGLTAWGIKILSAAEVSNSDGFDPSYNSSNVSLVDSFISNGDNHIAIKSDNGGSYTAGATKNISILGLQTGAGVGVNIGYDSSGGVSNVLVNGLVQKGSANNPGQQYGHGVFSLASPGQGGSVSNVTYENTCVTNEAKSLYYDYNSGSLAGAVELNTHILDAGGSLHSGSFTFQGTSSNKMGLTLSNVVADGTLTHTSSDLNVVWGPGNLSSNVQATTPNGGSIAVTNAAGYPNGASPYPCTTSTWQPLIGELSLNTSTQGNLQSFSGAAPATYTLVAVLRPATEVNSKESAALTHAVTFWDSVNGAPAVQVGSASLASNGTMATLPLTVSVSGTHKYTAQYSGDSNYPGTYTFGNPGTANQLVATLTSSAPTLLSAYLTTPGSVNSVVVGGTLQFTPYCHYSSGPDLSCLTPDTYGDVATSFASSVPAAATVVSGGHPTIGLATGVAVGSTNIAAAINHSAVVTPNFPLTVVAPVLTGVSLATTGGVTGLFVGSTNQLVATCSYSDSSTTNCTSTDSHGNQANTYVSTTPGHATVGSTTGLVTGIAAGSTTFTATAGTFTATAIPLTVLAVPSGVYTLTFSGPVSWSGSVSF